MRSSLVASSLIVAAACGGGDVTAPQPFPDVAGVYNVTGGFDNVPSSQASFAGTLTLTQATRQASTLGGTFAITATINGQVLSGTLSLQQASVSPAGVVTFVLNEGGNETWTFTGTLAGKVISGRHTLTDGTTTLSGSWTTGSATPPTTGTIEINTSTTGSSPDPDGYLVSVDGNQVGTLGASDGGIVPGLAPGNHVVGLSGVATNCQVQGENPRTVTVTVGNTVATTFAIDCPTPAPPTGTLRITTATTGTDQDPDGYAYVVDGGASQPIGDNAVATVASVAAGTHGVALNGVASNCTVQGDNFRTVTVTAGATVPVTFTILCEVPPSLTGTLRITTTTTGTSLDPDGYDYRFDSGTSQPIGINDASTLTNVTPGTHSVRLSGLALNCAVQGANPASATISAGNTAQLAFSVTCTVLIGPPNAIAAVSGDGQSGPVGSTLGEPLVVRVTDAFGTGVGGVTVTWSAEGGGSVSQASTQTGDDGKTSITRTLGLVAGQQTTRATVLGLAGSPVTFVHVATSIPPLQVVVFSGDGQAGSAGSALPSPLVVQVVDASGNPVPGRAVVWVIGMGGGSVTPQNSTTDVEGKASTSWTLGPAPGANTVNAVVSGVGFAGFTATGN